MYLLLSGEGPGDVGCYAPAADGSEMIYQPGPMALFVDQLIERQLGYDFSHIAYEQVRYVPKGDLVKNKQNPLKNKKSLRLPGKDRPIETVYYFENARALAALAKVESEEQGDTVIAVLFRDTDNNASAGRGEWEDKFRSMEAGFSIEAFDYGVPMVPKPKSEAWLLCAVKDNPYQHCDALENESGNDDSPNPLKAQLADALSGENSTAQLNERVLDGRIDVHQIEMASFGAFKAALIGCVERVSGQSNNE